MSTTPDVSVKLSTEGLHDLVQAFKRIQEETKNAAKEAEKAAGGFNKFYTAASSVQKAISALGVGKAVTMFTGMVKQSVDLAAGMGTLNQKTGMAVETLSVLSYAARTASLSQEQLDGAMVNFAKTMAKYDDKAKDVRDATENLFGNRNALQGLNQDQRFLKIADSLSWHCLKNCAALALLAL